MTDRLDPGRFDPDDLARVVVAEDVRLAPGGVMAAVRIVEPDIERDERRTRIEVLTVEDGRTVTTLEPGASLPRWSTNGRILTYLATDGQTRSLISLDLSEGNVQRSVLVPGIDLDVRELELAPDGQACVLAGTRPRAPGPLSTLPFEGPAARRPFVIDHPEFRSQTGDLLEPIVWEVTVATFDGGAMRQFPLPEGLWADTTEEVEGFEASWFPDGRSLAVSLSAGWDNDHRLPDPHRDLFRLWLDDGRYERLTDDARVCMRPKASPDGSAVAFLRQRGDDAATVFPFGVCVLDLGSGEVRAIGEPHDLDVRDLGWLPDGSGIYVVVVRRGRYVLELIEPDGSLLPVATGCLPGIDVTIDGQIGAVRSDPTTPADPVVVHPGGKVRVIRGLNPWLRDRATASTRTVTYTSAHPDGLQIHAIVAHPPDAEDLTRLPVVVDLHGGPYSAKGWWFDADREFFVGQGFVVVQPNYRGSVGYGQAFMQRSDRKHYPGWYDEPGAPHEMGPDVVGVIEAIREQGLGDPDRVFLRGVSAGAILTTWVLGRSDGFRAAVANSWYPGEWGAPMYGWYQLRRYAEGPPWDPEHTLDHFRRSPIMLIDKVKTPLLLIHGDRDYFTPQLETEKYFHALRGAGVDVALATFPDETHGIRRHPASIRASRVMEVEWFRSYDAKEGQG